MAERSFGEVRGLADKGYNVIPLFRELPADTLTPVSAFLRLNRGGGPAFLLESVEGGERIARYSFLGTEPFETLSVRDGELHVNTARGRDARLGGNPLLGLGRRLALYRAPRETGLPRFCGGAVGFVAYEMARHMEPSVRLQAPAEEARLMLFERLLAFDRVRHRVLLVSNVLANGALGPAYRKARRALGEMQALLEAPLAEPLLPPAPAGRPVPQARASLDERGFVKGVRSLKRHIRAGDIFQGVLSVRFQRPIRAEPFSVYRALRAVNPSPYMFFIDMGERAVLGASPEMLVRVEDGFVETRPIAGTRPRGRTEEEDRRLERQLLSSVKENAEHLMLVDLGRNDLGRVSRPGSVEVPTLRAVERYSHVMHLVSSVRGRLRKGLSPWDAFAACFPAGTVTGAPKIRAMQILSSIEPVSRGVYAGAVVYQDFTGNLDSAIAIRCMSLERAGAGRVATVQAGAGVVADSRPQRELEEVKNKARAMWEAVRIAENGPASVRAAKRGRK